MQIARYGIIFILISWISTLAQAKESDVPVYTPSKPAIVVTASTPEFTIQLKSNPTTGYSWFLREYDSSLVTPLKHTFQPPANKKLIGAPGYEYWTFRLKPAGFIVPQQTLLRFVYTRPWEVVDSSTQQVFKITTN